MMTFFISGLWHGFYAFYHIMFFFTAILQEVSKDLYKSRILFNFIPEILRAPLAWLITYIFVNYLGTCVNALSMENGMKFLRATHYYIFILIILGFIIMRGCGIVKYARQLEKNAETTKKV